MLCVGKIICNIGIYQPETDTCIGTTLEDTIALYEKKITCIICIIYLPDQKPIRLFEMRIFHPVPHRELPYVLEGNPHYKPDIFGELRTLINIFSTQL